MAPIVFDAPTLAEVLAHRVKTREIGHCHGCGRPFVLTIDGNVRVHFKLPRGAVLGSKRCPGSGEPPRKA